jgi:glycerol uptake facilitator-like aquaporin
MTLPRRLLSEFLATGLLLAIVIGSGIMGERLADGNVAVALLANALATAAGLFVLIEIFGPVSAHMNPAVSVVLAARRELAWRAVPAYVVAQCTGAASGAWLAHAMFELPLLQWSTTVRTGWGQWIAEAVATAGLVLVVLRAPAGRVAALVASYIGAAYWFTASTSFANPAATFGRMLTDTFAGIEPRSVAGFLIAQFIGALIGLLVHARLAVAQRIGTNATPAPADV